MRPKKPSASSLKNICIKFIALDTRTKYDYEGILPTLALEVLKRKIHFNNVKFVDVDALVKPGLTHINMRIPEDGSGIRILKAIGRTQKALKDVRLYPGQKENFFDDTPKEMLEAFKDFSQCLKTVVRLEFYIHLPVDKHEDLLPLWMQALNQSPQLEHLNIDFDDEEFCVMALKKLKKLKVLNVMDTVQTVFHMWQEDPDLKLGPTHMSVNNDTMNADELTIAIATQVGQVLPAVKSFIFRSQCGADLYGLNNIQPCIKTLDIEMHSNYTANSISSVVNHHGSTLTKLCLYIVKEIDFAHIIKFCPNLEELDIGGCYNLVENEPIDNCLPLKSLKKLSLIFADCGYDGFELPAVSIQIWNLLLNDDMKHLAVEHSDCSTLRKALKEIYNVHYFPRLTSLVIQHNIGIESNDLSPIINNSKTSLKHVSFLS